MSESGRKSKLKLIKAAVTLLEDEIDEEDEVLLQYGTNMDVDDLFSLREEEGTFNILVDRHLVDKETKFTKYLRVTPYLFDIILNTIQVDLRKKPCGKHPNPISPSQKLCIALR